MTVDEQFTLEEITTQLAAWLMEERRMGLRDAMACVYNSHLYSMLQDSTTGLMSQSDAYLYDSLCLELE